MALRGSGALVLPGQWAKPGIGSPAPAGMQSSPVYGGALPAAAQLIDFAQQLGIDGMADAELLWIAGEYLTLRGKLKAQETQLERIQQAREENIAKMQEKIAEIEIRLSTND